jgi:hypothetical protein
MLPVLFGHLSLNFHLNANDKEHINLKWSYFAHTSTSHYVRIFLNSDPELISMIFKFTHTDNRTKIPFIQTEQKCTSH